MRRKLGFVKLAYNMFLNLIKQDYRWLISYAEMNASYVLYVIERATEGPKVSHRKFSSEARCDMACTN